MPSFSSHLQRFQLLPYLLLATFPLLTPPPDLRRTHTFHNEMESLPPLLVAVRVASDDLQKRFHMLR